MGSMDEFGRAAFDMVTGAAARQAFDLAQESEATRERYGMHRWGQSCLLARRLVEAGVTFVTVNLDPHSFTFDMHVEYRARHEKRRPAHGLRHSVADRGPARARARSPGDGDRVGRIRPHAASQRQRPVAITGAR